MHRWEFPINELCDLKPSIRSIVSLLYRCIFIAQYCNNNRRSQFLSMSFYLFFFSVQPSLSLSMSLFDFKLKITIIINQIEYFQCWKEWCSHQKKTFQSIIRNFIFSPLIISGQTAKFPMNAFAFAYPFQLNTQI